MSLFSLLDLSWLCLLKKNRPLWEDTVHDVQGKQKMNNIKSQTILFISLLFLELCILDDIAYAGRDMTEQELRTPVLIFHLHKKVAGSGFFFEDTKINKYFLITAKHVLFQSTDVQLSEFPPGLNISKKILFRLHYDKMEKRLSFFGVMSTDEKKELLHAASNNELFKNAIEALYDKSQQLKLIDNTVVLSFYQSNNRVGEIQLQLARLLKNGHIWYHLSSDVALVHIGNITTQGEKRRLNFVDGVVGTEKVDLVGVLSSGVKTFNDVFIGNGIFTFGYPVSITQANPALNIKVPFLRKGLVAGKNDDLKLIILDCSGQRGDSGGLVMEVEDVFPVVTLQAIGVMTDIILTDDLTKSENSGLSVAVPMDDVLEIVKDWNTKKK